MHGGGGAGGGFGGGVGGESKDPWEVSVEIRAAKSAFTFKTLMRDYAQRVFTHGK